jgi:hypothetical protein
VTGRFGALSPVGPSSAPFPALSAAKKSTAKKPMARGTEKCYLWMRWPLLLAAVRLATDLEPEVAMPKAVTPKAVMPKTVTPKAVNFFDTIGDFSGSLVRWQNELARAKLDVAYAKAAQVHIQRSQDWIKPILRKPVYVKTIKNPDAIKHLRRAVLVIENSNPERQESLATTGRAIDKALKSTYVAIRASVWPQGLTKKGFTIGEPPISYEKTLSFLPGDSDFPTDD